MRMFTTGLAAACLLALAACAGTSGLAGTEVALTETERLALAYVTLPACPGAALCSDAAVVAKIKAADNIAYAAVMGAKAGKVLPADATAAVAALASLIPVAK